MKQAGRLKLTRKVNGPRIYIETPGGEQIWISVSKTTRHQASIMIEAQKDVKILREEIINR